MFFSPPLEILGFAVQNIYESLINLQKHFECNIAYKPSIKVYFEDKTHVFLVR